MLKRRRRNVSSPPQQPLKRPRAQRKREPEHRDRYDWITLWTAVVGVALVCVGTGISAYQAIVTRQELDNAIGQLNYTVSQQRPWVRLTVVPSSGFGVRDGQGVMYFKVLATNAGPVPAIDVNFETRAFASSGAKGGAFPDFNETVQCHAAETPGVGATIFPGETVELHAANLISKDDIKRHMDKSGLFGLLITACANYRGTTKDRLFHTKATFVVQREPVAPAYVDFFQYPNDMVPGKLLDFSRLGVAEEAK